ncbi:MAG TPA: Na-translocating system protein MpsC family protein [Bacilli bacterium]|nr:Na-translocating system protein MpsC family protein [Bacilli bacterium]
MNNGPQHEGLQHISSYTSKMLRQKFGRGPESCHASLGDRFLVLYIRGFLSPMEEVLLQQGEMDTVATSRKIIIDSILPELKGVVQLTLEIDIAACYSDWNFISNTGVIVIELQADEGQQATGNEFAGREAFEEEIIRLSAIVQKTPERVESYQLSPRVMVVMRYGMLLMIEHALIQKGMGQPLRITKGELEKKYFHADGRFDKILGQQVIDFFVDWDFKKDNSLMCFVLK